MRHAHYKLLPHRERPRSRVPASFPALYLQGRRRGRLTHPFGIPGLKLWLKADALSLSNNSPVDAWADSSGSGNGVMQNTGMKRPTFKTNQLNGLPVVRFDGIDDTLFKLAAAGFTCRHGHTVFAVLNPTTAVAYGMAVVTRFGYNEMRQYGGGGYPEWMLPSGLYQVDGSAYLQGLWKVWTGTYSVASQTVELFINGASQGTVIDDGPLAVTDIYLGSRTDSYNWLGDMAEVLIYDGVLSVAQRQTIEKYLIAKYALP